MNDTYSILGGVFAGIAITCLLLAAFLLGGDIAGVNVSKSCDKYGTMELRGKSYTCEEVKR